MGQAKVAYLLYWTLAAETQLRKAQADRSNDMNFYLQIDTTWYEITRGVGLPLQIPKKRIMVFIYASWILVGVDRSWIEVDAYTFLFSTPQIDMCINNDCEWLNLFLWLEEYWTRRIFRNIVYHGLYDCLSHYQIVI